MKLALFVTGPVAPSTDIRDVTAAAAALQIGEFAFFQLAHRTWFGHEAPEEAIEPPFMTYLFQARAPHWVRHTARQVLTLANHGRLDRGQFGLPPTAGAVPDKVDAGRVRDVIMLFVWLGLFLFLLAGMV